MMLSCENNPPYGPSINTAKMLLDIIIRARLSGWFERYYIISPSDESSSVQHVVVDSSENDIRNEMNNDDANNSASVSIFVYECKDKDYPASDTEWDLYDGILLPGSFNSAYDMDDWVGVLKRVLREEVHANRRRTLGICFGHQILAHSLGEKGGLAAKCPAGPQAGGKNFVLTEAGKAVFGKNCDRNGNGCFEDEKHDLQDSNWPRGKVDIQLLYTHGDMVQELPACALSLGGNSNVSIQSAAYFVNSDSSKKFRSNSVDGDDYEKPYAITFQAHPEYASPIAVETTLTNVVNAMVKRGAISSESQDQILEEVKENFSQFSDDSLHVITNTCASFGWL